MDVIEVKKLMEAEGGARSGITTTSSSKICKYWANGNCKHDKRCQNLHSWSDRILIKDQKDNPKGIILVWWTAPPYNFVKINCDGALTTFHGNKASAGGVMRDCKGRFIIGFSSPLRNCDTVVEAGLWAIKIGMEIAMSLGFRNLVIESDSYTTVQLINTGVLQISPYTYGDLVSSIICLVKRPVIFARIMC